MRSLALETDAYTAVSSFLENFNKYIVVFL